MLTIAEHSSNLMPWTRLAQQTGANVRIVDVDDEGRPRLDQLKQLLSKRTRVVAFSHVSNVLGYINPAKEICALARAGRRARRHRRRAGRAARRRSTCRIWAATSTCSQATRCSGRWAPAWCGDAASCSTRCRRITSAATWRTTWTSSDAEFEHGAQKFQAGTPDVAGPVGLAAAVLLRGSRARCCSVMTMISCGMVWRDWPRSRRCASSARDSPEHRVPVFTFVVEGHAAAAVAKALDARGIAVRAGDMAALPLLKRFGTSEAVRASAYVYSTRADLDRLADALLAL